MSKPGTKDKRRRTTSDPSQNLQPSEIPEALNLAIQIHKAGDQSKAEDIYRRILHADPQHRDALHLLGVIAFQSGYNDEALGLITKALKIAPNFPEALNNLGNVLVEMVGGCPALISGGCG